MVKLPDDVNAGTKTEILPSEAVLTQTVILIVGVFSPYNWLYFGLCGLNKVRP